MAFDAIFTLRSLEVALERSSDTSWLDPTKYAQFIEWGLARVSVTVSEKESVFFVSAEDTLATPRIVIPGIGTGESLDRLPRDAWRQALQRVHRTALAAVNPPVRLPRDWSEYHFNNLLAFFACNRTFGSFRWIAELHAGGTDDLVFWKTTDSGDALLLANFQPDKPAYQRIAGAWGDALKKAQTEVFAKFPRPPTYVPLEGAIDLQHATYGAVTGDLTFSRWVQKLTDQQRAFIEHTSASPVKLRGPAGSGKTLALELKALRELYAGHDAGTNPRILFVTHSWAMAVQVDAALHRLDERGLAREISVYPLAEIAKGVLLDRFPQGLNLLGDDSFTGRRLLLDKIADALHRIKAADWIAYRGGVTPDLRERVESAERSPEWNSLVWDLMHEFSSVLGASGILPGMTADRRYLALRRANWMMPLGTDTDKRFVLRVFSEYVKLLRDSGLLSIDQLTNDFLSYLETFAWDYQRAKQGYDVILVDEYHLFSDQERQTLNYLSKNPQAFPRLIMALDPRQSPSEMYHDFPVANVASAQSREPEIEMGAVEAIDLTTVHRFSPQVLELVKFIHQSFPTLDLGADWVIDTAALRSSAAVGELPTLYQYGTAEAEIVGVAKRAGERHGTSGPNRVAVVLVDDRRLPEFESSLAGGGYPLVTIKSRDDIDTLRYARRSVVLSSAEHIAGLQFEDVIVAGLPTELFPKRISDPQMRRILSALYVAVTRASRHVELHFLTASGESDLAVMLQRAVQAGVLEQY